MTDAERREATALVGFWFCAPNSVERFAQRDVWFKADPDFDAELGRRFLALQKRAASGGCADWAREAEPCLALVLLLDQLPRNLYRGKAEAFATDARAREAAQMALSRGFDRSLPAAWRQFFYLPFEHSESLADQQRSVALFAVLARDPSFAGSLDYALRHQAIIARFGRFPHRNRALGRPSTAAEEAFLTEPNSSF
jgi:uncharacterized protein (DUF924 family)